VRMETIWKTLNRMGRVLLWLASVNLGTPTSPPCSYGLELLIPALETDCRAQR
jgi:hypothetical protein